MKSLKISLLKNLLFSTAATAQIFLLNGKQKKESSQKIFIIPKEQKDTDFICFLKNLQTRWEERFPNLKKMNNDRRI